MNANAMLVSHLQIKQLLQGGPLLETNAHYKDRLNQICKDLAAPPLIIISQNVDE